MQKLRLLVVEDSDRDTSLLVHELKRGNYDVTFTRVETEETMRAALENGSWDLIVSDYTMPHFSAHAALALAKAYKPDLPFIIVSGTVSEEVAVDAMRAGAHDFMSKAKLARLLPAIKRELREAAGRAERREIELQLRQAQKMEAIGQLTGGISHDFNNLLSVIVGNIELLLDQLQDNVSGTELATGALNSALHGADLTRRLLTFSRQQPFETRVVDINELLRNILTMLQRTLGESVQISVELADALWRVRIDPSQVEDALVNLAINARDAMPDGGTIVIKTENYLHLAGQDAHAPANITAGDYILLSVVDTGVGMSPDVLERAIEPFFTTKEQGKGTGLGLTMVYGFAKQSGGFLGIESGPNMGTKIKVYLPKVVGGELDARDAVRLPDSLPRGSESILVVDDNVELRVVEVRQLTTLGYRVRDAGTGADALKMLEAGEVFDLLLTDIGLPDGMTGYQLAELARRRQSSLKVVFVTGYAKTTPASDDAQVEVQHVLRKPYRLHELATKMREVLDSVG